MTKVQEQIDRIEYTKREIRRTKSIYRRRDLERSLRRLERELYTCARFMEESKNVSTSNKQEN